MGRVTQRTTLDFEKSTYLIDHVTYDNGIKSIEIIQQFKQGNFPDASIKISADNLPSILDTLSQYSDGLPKPEAITKEKEMSLKNIEKLTSSYLKGVSIKDLAMQTGFKETTIIMILKNNDIEIVHPKVAKAIQFFNPYRKRRN